MLNVSSIIVENFQVLSVPDEHKHVTFTRKKNDQTHQTEKSNFAEKHKRPQIKIEKVPQVEVEFDCKQLDLLKEKTFPYKVKQSDTLFSISLKYGVR